MDIENHISSTFNNELLELNTTLLEMGGYLEEQFKQTMKVCSTKDTYKAKEIIKMDSLIDDLENKAINQIQLLIAKRQPVGVDLRILVGCTRIAGYMERIGDLLSSISRRTIILVEYINTNEEAALLLLAKKVDILFKDALNAFADKNFNNALAVKNKDIDIDKTYNNFFTTVLKEMAKNSKLVIPGTHLLFMAKNFERIGDHATNIAESITYMSTGDIKQELRPKEKLI